MNILETTVAMFSLENGVDMPCVMVELILPDL